ncbi:methyltransferase FkbM family [Syntrophobotulus glycolicus DSM 8271]|uniref:Methyltransferase FkbM family n=1 Tax=Syntrophobotulus glycolicus (strain DSM 8271 / FlGlyR) TaxID=645991 RepID=F0SZC7_SYNGF|nr:FkbM family methyltransferase [Syntrophobotulus glycolicus]ADY54932.1 methyltransferase FkbM family [Syntrophobotulus glycolicus DSM 8271]
MNLIEARHHVAESIKIQVPPDYHLKEDIAQGKKILIYSAGITGKLVFNILKFLGTPVAAFLDRSATPGQLLYGLPVYKADDMNMPQEYKNFKVIIALDRFKYSIGDITAYLNELGFTDVIYSHSVMCMSNYYHFNNTYNTPGVNLRQEEKEILQALELMGDDQSRDVFCSFLRAYATSEFDNTVISAGYVDYVKTGITLNKGFSCFVDCGAYTGDTYEEVKKYYKVNTYIGFEPNAEIFKKLTETVESSDDNQTTAFLYPCAVGDKAYYASFNDELNGGSTLSEKGKQTVQVVKLDDVLKNANPTLIKMDVEGAEIDALNGCKGIIKENKPDLAICVYHRLTDLWRIPLLIHEFEPEYKLYMRCHSIATLETVLYGTH